MKMQDAQIAFILAAMIDSNMDVLDVDNLDEAIDKLLKIETKASEFEELTGLELNAKILSDAVEIKRRGSTAIASLVGYIREMSNQKHVETPRDWLSVPVSDSVTGFSGIVTAVCEYANDETAQVQIENDKETRWVSLNRIKEL